MVSVSGGWAIDTSGLSRQIVKDHGAGCSNDRAGPFLLREYAGGVRSQVAFDGKILTRKQIEFQFFRQQ
jgi:hypothetical protein